MHRANIHHEGAEATEPNKKGRPGLATRTVLLATRRDSYFRFGTLSELVFAISKSFASRSVYIACWSVMIDFL